MSCSPRGQLAACLLVIVAARASAAPAPLAFHLTFDPAIHERPFTGRVYVLLSKTDLRLLPSGPNWFRPEPFFALDVKDWRPGQALVLDGRALGYPSPLARLPKGTYTIHAVMDLDQGARSFSAAAGNVHNKPTRRELDPATTGPVPLHLDQAHQDKVFRGTERVRLVSIKSNLLSSFYGRPTYLHAGVVLPASYGQHTEKRYPVVYEVPGFGGNHFMAFSRAERNATDLGSGVEALWVVLGPDCRTGHHVFADSDNNGPCGRALVEELIPAVESRYRTVGNGQGRVVTGHSSGGWSSLWLQVAYPEVFAGTWSTAPDPVDFRDFQRIDLYRPGANMFTDEAGKPRPIARSGNKPSLWYKGFSDMEEVMGHGGQLASFEAVFSPKGTDGRPRKLWDRATGAVDPEVAHAWQRYDIRLVMERNWKALAPKLAGKLHVYTGGEDTFYLEGAVALLKESLSRLGSDAVVEIVPGKDHGNLIDKPMRERISREMAGALRNARPD